LPPLLIAFGIGANAPIYADAMVETHLELPGGHVQPLRDRRSCSKKRTDGAAAPRRTG
jgi:hypothetical protein